MHTQEFEQRLKELQPKLMIWARQHVRQIDAAEDLIQETLLKAWGRRHQFDPSRGSFKSWLSRIMRNTAIDTSKTAAVRFTHFLEDSLSVVPAEEPRQHEVTESMQALRHIAVLAPKYRGAFGLVLLGLTDAEIAQRADIPLGTAKTHIRRAKLQLQERLASI